MIKKYSYSSKNKKKGTENSSFRKYKFKFDFRLIETLFFCDMHNMQSLIQYVITVIRQ